MMDIGALLKSFIYLISSSLLYPVLLLLVLLSVITLVLAGSFVAEWLERLRLHAAPPEKLPLMLKQGLKNGNLSARVTRYMGVLQGFETDRGMVDLSVENLFQETSLSLWKSLDRLKILVRVAPSLGLIGTLIPMGTGLAALGQGDMTQLTTDLVIAFTTTVVGMAIGTAAFFFYTIKRRWIEQDVKTMALATDIFLAGTKKETYDGLF